MTRKTGDDGYRGKCGGCRRLMATSAMWDETRELVPDAECAHARRGLCRACSSRLRDRYGKGRPINEDAKPWRRKEHLMEEWAFARDTLNMSLREAAVYMSIPYSTLERAFYRSKKVGDPRASRERYAGVE